MSRTATIDQCVIIAANIALDDVGGQPFIFWKLHELLRFGVTRALVLGGPWPDPVQQAVLHAADTLPKRLDVSFLADPGPPDAASALLHASDALENRFWLTDAATLLDTNLAAILAEFAADPPGCLGRTGIHGKKSAAIHALDKRVLDRLSPDASFGRDTLPKLVQAGVIRTTELHGRLFEITTAEGQAHAQRELPSRLHRPALLLDRDGVLNIDHGYVGTPDRFEWTPGAREAVALAVTHGWHVFVASNQSGVARGLYTEAESIALMGWLADELRRAGGTLDDWRICPTHPEAIVEAYRRESDWRKPGPGMLTDLARVWNIEPRKCLMVGDRDTDMQAAAAAGMAGQLFGGQNLLEFVRPLLGVVSEVAGL